jgi:uncharacterized phage protein (TIGR01671 family)
MKDNFQELFDYCYNELGSTPLLTQMYDIISIAQKTNRRSTQRKDRNGVEIFEGDYLVDRYEDEGEIHEYLYEVVYCPRLMAWAIDVSYAQDGSRTESIREFFGDCLEVKNPLPLTRS